MTRPIIRFIGDTVVLQCRTNRSASLSWLRRIVSIASTSRGVFSGYPRLSLNVSTEGQFDLLISSTQQEDAGSYTCLIWGPIARAELILLGECFVLIAYKPCIGASLVAASLQLTTVTDCLDA